MQRPKNLADVSISKLIEYFEEDIRFGCHSTLTEVGRSYARQELEKRSKEEVIHALHSRWKAIGEDPGDNVERDIRNGISMLMQKIEQK